MALNTYTKIETLKYFRELDEQKPIEYNGNVYDFNQQAIIRLLIAHTVLNGTDNTIAWTTTDDNVVMINASDIKNIILASMQRANLLHEKYRKLFKRVEEAQTQEELDAIVW